MAGAGVGVQPASRVLQGPTVEWRADTLMKNEYTPPAQAKQTFAADTSNPIVLNKTANWVWVSPRGLAEAVGCLVLPHFSPPPHTHRTCSVAMNSPSLTLGEGREEDGELGPKELGQVQAHAWV